MNGIKKKKWTAGRKKNKCLANRFTVFGCPSSVNAHECKSNVNCISNSTCCRWILSMLSIQPVIYPFFISLEKIGFLFILKKKETCLIFFTKTGYHLTVKPNVISPTLMAL
jgi:hypothetical protein